MDSEEACIELPHIRLDEAAALRFERAWSISIGMVEGVTIDSVTGEFAVGISLGLEIIPQLRRGLRISGPATSYCAISKISCVLLMNNILPIPTIATGSKPSEMGASVTVIGAIFK